MFFYLLLIAIWEMAFRSRLWPEYLFPSPSGVFRSLGEGIKDGSLLLAAAVSMQRVITGFLISLAGGILLGVALVRIRFLEECFGPLLLGLQTLPSICWLPLAVLWFGMGEKAILFVVAAGSLFSIAISFTSGVKNISPLYRWVAKTMGASGWQMFTTVIFPAALPSFVAGMKQGWSFAWRALLAGELLSPQSGLGYVLVMGRDLQDMNLVVAVMVVILLLGLAVEKLFFARVEASLRSRWGLDRA